MRSGLWYPGLEKRWKSSQGNRRTFFLEKEPMRLTLHTMGSIEVIRAQRKQVYVVEKSGSSFLF